VLYHEEASLPNRLQVVANRLAGIREQRIYPLLRFDDRVQLRAILQRIGRWLTNVDRDPEEGTHIWEDLAGAVHLLANVTEREEVRDHDFAVLERAHRTLFESRQPPHHLPEDLRYELHTLMGLDDGLDNLLLGAGEPPLSAWQEEIARLWKETERRTTGDRPYDAWPLG
jgi:hypothetical protein